MTPRKARGHIKKSHCKQLPDRVTGTITSAAALKETLVTTLDVQDQAQIGEILFSKADQGSGSNLPSSRNQARPADLMVDAGSLHAE